MRWCWFKRTFVNWFFSKWQGMFKFELWFRVETFGRNHVAQKEFHHWSRVAGKLILIQVPQCPFTWTGSLIARALAPKVPDYSVNLAFLQLAKIVLSMNKKLSRSAERFCLFLDGVNWRSIEYQGFESSMATRDDATIGQMTKGRVNSG